jgi:hypothetical protein
MPLKQQGERQLFAVVSEPPHEFGVGQPPNPLGV